MLEKLPEAIGHALFERRAGLDKLGFYRVGLRAGMGTIEVRSSAFVDHAPLPARFTADGAGVSPPLQWSGLPPDTVSVVLLVEDADSPTPWPLVHAIVTGMPPEQNGLAEAAIDRHADDAPRHVGRNSFLGARWLPPDPPPGHGVHRYAFQVFALGADVPRSETPGRDEVLDAVRRSALASGLLIGTFERPDGSVREPATAADPAPVAPDLDGSR